MSSLVKYYEKNLVEEYEHNKNIVESINNFIKESCVIFNKNYSEEKGITYDEYAKKLIEYVKKYDNSIDFDKYLENFFTILLEEKIKHIIYA